MDAHDEGSGADTLLGSLLEAVIEAMGEGVVVFDGGGRVADARPSARAVLGALDGTAGAGPGVPPLLGGGGRRGAPHRGGPAPRADGIPPGPRGGFARRTPSPREWWLPAPRCPD